MVVNATCISPHIVGSPFTLVLSAPENSPAKMPKTEEQEYQPEHQHIPTESLETKVKEAGLNTGSQGLLSRVGDPVGTSKLILPLLTLHVFTTHLRRQRSWYGSPSARRRSRNDRNGAIGQSRRRGYARHTWTVSGKPGGTA